MLSVVVPVYNVEEYIYECIESILNQDIDGVEIIVINDGSTDNSLKIVKSFNDERIRIIDKENGGLSSARNVGLKEAVGEYVIFIDSDDYLKDKSVLAEMYNLAKKNNSDIVAGNFYKKFSESKVELIKFPFDEYNNKTISGKEFLLKYLKEKCYSAIVCKNMFKLEFLKKEKLCFIEGIYHEDELFTPLAFKNAEKVTIYNNDFYVYRQRAGSIMSSASMNKRVEDIFYISGVLLNEFQNIEEGELRALFFQYIAEMILNYSYKNRLKYIPKTIKRKLLRTNYNKKIKFRIILFNFNSNLYYLFEKFREK